MVALLEKLCITAAWDSVRLEELCFNQGRALLPQFRMLSEPGPGRTWLAAGLQ